MLLNTHHADNDRVITAITAVWAADFTAYQPAAKVYSLPITSLEKEGTMNTLADFIW